MPVASAVAGTAQFRCAKRDSVLPGLPDEEDFERLILPLLSDVVRFSRSLTRDAARADDLVQETYLQALRGWHTFQLGADPRRWLFAVCHHAFLRTVREESRYVDAPDDDPELESLATAQAHYQAECDGALRALDRIDLGPAIERAVATLPAHFRSVILLVDVEGQSYEEAATILGVAIGTIRSRLFRARRQLQDCLFEYARDVGIRAADAVPVPVSSASLK
jgi:RNA polymerase sigma-70 factor (ECF subfamily)